MRALSGRPWVQYEAKKRYMLAMCYADARRLRSVLEFMTLIFHRCLVEEQLCGEHLHPLAATGRGGPTHVPTANDSILLHNRDQTLLQWPHGHALGPFTQQKEAFLGRLGERSVSIAKRRACPGLCG